jgi:type I restriction enzyme M protein
MKEKDLTFEDKLWKAADKLRKKEKLKKEYRNNPKLEKILEDKDYYLSERTLYVPEEAR